MLYLLSHQEAPALTEAEHKSESGSSDHLQLFPNRDYFLPPVFPEKRKSQMENVV